MLNLFLVRHGNTFDKGDTIKRVGLRTDLPLSTSGVKQAQTLGSYLSTTSPSIDSVYYSELQRTKQTASIIMEVINQSPSQAALPLLNEIDYGVDEGKPEHEVRERLGSKALDDWDKHLKVPQGWSIDPDKLIPSIQMTCKQWSIKYKNMSSANLLLVSSNGILRFFPMAVGIPTNSYKVKMGTGCISHLMFENDSWTLQYWNKSPTT